MDFLLWLACNHCGPITQTIQTGLWVAIFFSLIVGFFRRDGAQYIAIAFLVSFAGAKISTILGSTFAFAPFLLIAAIISTQWRHPWAGKVIAGLYLVRLVWLLVVLLVGFPNQWFWNVNTEVMLTLQIIICFLGGLVHGGSIYRRRKGIARGVGVLFPRRIFAKVRATGCDTSGSG